jgi:hypothetical protein
MRLSDFCTVFPDNPEDWPPAKLSSALPFPLRAKVKARFGSILAASDMARLKAASRLGVALRPFEPGDGLSTLSRSHLLRTGEVLTRVDFAPGRQKAGVIFHGYEDMRFRSSIQQPNKGQIALGVSAFLEAAHGSLSHEFQMLCFKSQELGKNIKELKKTIRGWNFCYIITDLFFDKVGLEASGTQLMNALTEIGVSKPLVFLARDPEEWPQASVPLSQQRLLKPFAVGEEDPFFYSGKEYVENLRLQFKLFNESLKTIGGEAHIVTQSTTAHEIVELLLLNLTRKLRQ